MTKVTKCNDLLSILCMLLLLSLNRWVNLSLVKSDCLWCLTPLELLRMWWLTPAIPCWPHLRFSISKAMWISLVTHECTILCILACYNYTQVKSKKNLKKNCENLRFNTKSWDSLRYSESWQACCTPERAPCISSSDILGTFHYGNQWLYTFLPAASFTCMERKGLAHKTS